MAGAIDADVPVGEATHPGPLRRVGVHTPQGDGCFRTNLPPRLGPRQVADRYRVRWAVERRLRLDTSVHRVDAVDSARPCSLKPLLQASRIASMSAALLAHTHHRQTRPQQERAARTAAPRHPRRLALPLAFSCQTIAQAFARQGTEARQRWNQIAARLLHSGTDPHWRRRPSVVAQRRGWTRQPLRGQQTSRRNLKAAA